MGIRERISSKYEVLRSMSEVQGQELGELVNSDE